MTDERKKLVRNFIRSAYLLPEYVKLFDHVFEIMAMSEGKRVKKGKDWDTAAERVMSDEFIDDLDASFPSLSVEDLIDLTMFHQSIAMKKFRKARDVKDFGIELHDALFKEFVE